MTAVNCFFDFVAKRACFKVIVFLAQALVWLLMIRTNTVVIGGFFVSHEVLTPLAIPAFVRSLINIAAPLKLLPNILHRPLMMTVCCTNKVAVLDTKRCNKCLEITIHAIDVGLWLHARIASLRGNFVAMLVSTHLEANSFTILFLVTRPYICQRIIERMADVWNAVNVRNSSGNIKIFSHYI